MLRFDFVIFASKRNKVKRNSSIFFRFFSFFFVFFRFFHFFSLNFRFALIFSLNFRLYYLCFRFRLLVFRIEVNHVKSGFFFASKRNEIFASISNFASEAKVRAHPTRIPLLRKPMPCVLSGGGGGLLSAGGRAGRGWEGRGQAAREREAERWLCYTGR